jgi:hypothetical protein
MNEVFANQSKEDKIYPLTTAEITEAQQADATPKHLFKRNAVIDQGLEIKLIENTTCVCKDGWLHSRCMQSNGITHPGHTHLGEMMNAAMYWKGMHTIIWSITRSCRSCQTNKR